jgi:hypothetical protein
MSESGLYTLADLSEHHAIYAFCDPCNRSVKLNPARLSAMYGHRFTIAELKQRLTCPELRGADAGDTDRVYGGGAVTVR